MFGSCSGYSKQERLALTKALLTDAQQLADTKQIPVILCGDRNCPVDEINLPVGAFQALPSLDLDSIFKDDGIDGIFFLNPVGNLGKLKLSDEQFFKWVDNVMAEDIGGLKPEDIDKIYCLGGKHHPIVANLIAN